MAFSQLQNRRKCGRFKPALTSQRAGGRDHHAKLDLVPGRAIALVFVLCTAGLIFLKTCANGFSARAEPCLIERWVARQARAMAAPAGARDRTNPIGNSPEVLAEARAHWADHCAVCHANNGSGDTEMGRHMYPPAPDMRQADTQNLNEEELFYIIQNGIRLSGMPSCDIFSVARQSRAQ